jgi:tetratricopeptide (TPR) repeat protein
METIEGISTGSCETEENPDKVEQRSWESWALTQAEERKNFLRLLCLFKDAQLFQEVVDFWEEANQGLWELGYWNDYYECTSVALKAAESLGDLAVTSRILRQLGWSHMEWDDFPKSRNYMRKSLSNARLSGDSLEECDSLRCLGTLYHRWKRFTYAAIFYGASLKIIDSVRSQKDFQRQSNDESSKRHNWAFQEASMHNLLGSLYLKLNRFSESYEELSLSLQQYSDLGHIYRYYQTAPLINLGKWHFAQQEFHKAKERYEECYDLSQEIGRIDTAATAILLQAQLAWTLEDSPEALRLTNRSIELSGNEIIGVRERAFKLKEMIIGSPLIEKLN